jgi:hypothetical protein
VLALAAAAQATACIPKGNSPRQDAGAGSATPAVRQSPDVLRTVFEDSFERPAKAVRAATLPGSEPQEPGDEGGQNELGGLGPEWVQAGTEAWRIEEGKLCASQARNHGVWLKRPIPINARIEFDAYSFSPDGDLKAELWGDGVSAATDVSYTNATSYLVIFGGWKNTIHALARINEHGKDRKEIRVDSFSDDPRQRPVKAGQPYRFKIERGDGRTVRWWVDDTEMLSFEDTAPLAGLGHDHFGFNNWLVKVCFDNVRVTPL